MRFRKSRLVRVGSIILAGLLAVISPAFSPAANDKSPAKVASSRSSEAAADALRQALQAEIAGDASTRAKHLEAALHASPNDAQVRGAAGFLRKDKRWVGYDALVEEARGDKRLAEYRQRRKDSEPTIASQLTLADWCRKQRLAQQERAHLTAVLSLDPENAQVRQRLGYVRVGDRWTTSEDATTGRQQAQAVAESLRKNAASFTSLAKQLERHEVTEEVALTRLAEFRNPHDIPALETYLSQANEEAARCVVKILATGSSVEASHSLVRHALASSWPNVRRDASEELKKRDPHTFVPAILSSFESTWASQAELYQAADGRLLCRHSLFSEGPEKRQLAVHDHVLMPIGFIPDAANRATAQLAMTTIARQNLQNANNQRIEAKNQALGTLLQTVTGEQLGNDASNWWRWWNDQNECFIEGSKPLEQVYAITSSYVVGVPPVQEYTLPSAPSGGRQTRQECLAGGTLVWTETGAVAVDRVRPGDLVLAQHPRTGELAFKPVLRTTVRAPEKLLSIHVGGNKIRATGGHPFWVAGKGWTLARQLQAGDLLHGLAGASSIERIDEETQPVRTFNLVVADFHSYFCGSDKLLSHDNTVRTPVSQTVPGLVDSAD